MRPVSAASSVAFAILVWAPTANAAQPVEAPRPTERTDVDAVMAGAAERLADAGPIAFAEALADFDPTGVLRRTVEPFQTKWKSERTAGVDRVELIRKEEAGPSTVRFYHLLVQRRKPIIWMTTFVRVSRGGWFLRAFSASDRLHERRDLFRGATAPGDIAEPSAIAAEFADDLAVSDDAALRRLTAAFPEHDPDAGPETSPQSWGESMAGGRRLIRWRHERCELAAFEPLTASLVRVVYSEFSPDNQAVWELFLYRPADRWEVTAVHFQAGNDHTIELLFPGASTNPVPGPPSTAPFRN